MSSECGRLTVVVWHGSIGLLKLLVVLKLLLGRHLVLWGTSSKALAVWSVVELESSSWALAIWTSETDKSVSTFQCGSLADGTGEFAGGLRLSKIVCVQGRRREKKEKQGRRGEVRWRMINELEYVKLHKINNFLQKLWIETSYSSLHTKPKEKFTHTLQMVYTGTSSASLNFARSVQTAVYAPAAYIHA